MPAVAILVSEVPNQSKQCGNVLNDETLIVGGDIAAFDALFFRITAQEANAMDPNQRLALELSYGALENGKALLLLKHDWRWELTACPVISWTSNREHSRL